MGAGKSTVGRILGDRLGWAFVDTDAVVEDRLGLPIATVFAELGESRFREEERAVTAEALAQAGVVVATGGGWPMGEGTLESVPTSGLVVWLDAPVGELLERVSRQPGSRPLLEVDDPLTEARSLLARRERRYARAHLRVDTAGLEPFQIADRIAKRLQGSRPNDLQERPKAT